MSCNCTSAAIEGTNKFFSKQAKRYLKRFRKRGLAKEQRLLVEGIKSISLSGKSVLEIGCGIGGLHLSLLQQGASFATGIDISEGMLEGAKHLAQELGLESNTRYLLGDFVQTNGTVEHADITILDKVVCCYENLDALLVTSLDKTRHSYALSFPKSSFVVKTLFRTTAWLGQMFNWSFAPYWHDWDAMVKTIGRNGFKEAYRSNTVVWAVHVFERV